MKHKLSNFFLLVAIISGSIWLGTFVSRQLVFYYFFSDALGQQLKSYLLVEESAIATLNSIVPLLATTMISFAFYALTLGLHFILTEKSLKKNGWLFIVLILLVFQISVESYFLIKFDYEIFNKIYSLKFSGKEILNQIIERGKTLSSFPVLNVLISISIFALMIFKPLTKDES